VSFSFLQLALFNLTEGKGKKLLILIRIKAFLQVVCRGVKESSDGWVFVVHALPYCSIRSKS
jgi:hypothetical protein